MSADTTIEPRWLRLFRMAASGIFYLEMAGIALQLPMPPPEEPGFIKPPIIIIQPRKPYDEDVWWDTWDEYFI